MNVRSKLASVVALSGLLMLAVASAFAAAPAATLPVGTAPRGVVVLPNNDIAVANGGSNNVTVYRGGCTPACSYAQIAGSPFPVGTGPTSIARGHIKSTTGAQDLVTANFNSNDVTVLLNAAGTFATRFNVPAGPSPETVVVADFNNDGFDDIAVTNATGAAPSVTILRNLGNCAALHSAACFAPTTVSLAVPGLVLLPWGLAVGHFQSASSVDLVVSNYYSSDLGGHSAAVLFNNGSGAFTVNAYYNAGFYTPYVSAGRDTGGGQTVDDFVVSQYGGALYVFLNNGSGSFTGPVTPLPNAGTTPLAITHGQLTGNGRPDVVVTNYTAAAMTILTGAAGGVFGSPNTITVGKYPDAVAVSDLGNGSPDIVVVNQGDNNIMIFLGPF